MTAPSSHFVIAPASDNNHFVKRPAYPFLKFLEHPQNVVWETLLQAILTAVYLTELFVKYNGRRRGYKCKKFVSSKAAHQHTPHKPHRWLYAPTPIPSDSKYSHGFSLNCDSASSSAGSADPASVLHIRKGNCFGCRRKVLGVFWRKKRKTNAGVTQHQHDC